jgi:hypothetical protein
VTTVVVEEAWTETITHPATKDCDSKPEPPVTQPPAQDPPGNTQPPVQDSPSEPTRKSREVVEVPTVINSGL